MVPPPQRIRGDLPSDYDGPLYYTWRRLRSGMPKPPGSFIRIVDEPKPKRMEDEAGESLARADPQCAALKIEPRLFDEDGELLSRWQHPLQARLKANAPKQWADWPMGVLRYVSPQVRDAIEAVEPGRHLFIPVDVDAKDRDPFRLYILFPGNAARLTVLAMRANEISYTLSDGGTPVFHEPPWLHEDRFGYLNQDVLQDAHLFYDFSLSFIFSRALVEKLGDVFIENYAFKPWGVVTETRDSLC